MTFQQAPPFSCCKKSLHAVMHLKAISTLHCLLWNMHLHSFAHLLSENENLTVRLFADIPFLPEQMLFPVFQILPSVSVPNWYRICQEGTLPLPVLESHCLQLLPASLKWKSHSRSEAVPTTVPISRLHFHVPCQSLPRNVLPVIPLLQVYITLLLTNRVTFLF